MMILENHLFVHSPEWNEDDETVKYSTVIERSDRLGMQSAIRRRRMLKISQLDVPASGGGGGQSVRYILLCERMKESLYF